MDIVTKKTKKGIVIRFIFDSVEEYEIYMENFGVFSRKLGENKNENMEELIKLFKDYYKPCDKYCDGKPTVTVFEDHLLVLACQIWTIGDIYFILMNNLNNWMSEYIKLQKEHNKFLVEYGKLHSEYIKSLKI